MAKSKVGGSGRADHMFVGNQRECRGNSIGAIRELASTDPLQNTTPAGRTGALLNNITLDTTYVQAISRARSI